MRYKTFFNPLDDDIFDLIDFFQPIRLTKRPVIISVHQKDEPIYDKDGVRRNPVAPPENEPKPKTKPQQNVPEEKPEEKPKDESLEKEIDRLFTLVRDEDTKEQPKEEPKHYGLERQIIRIIKRPIINECVLWDGTDDTRGNIFVWSGLFAQVINNQLYLFPSKDAPNQKILTANTGDYVVKDEKGNFSVFTKQELHENYNM